MVAVNDIDRPANYVRKPNPITGFLDKVAGLMRRHKGWSAVAIIAAVSAIPAILAIGGGSKAKPEPAKQLSVCEAVAEWPQASRSDLVGLVLDSNPSMSRRQAQDLVAASTCAPR